MSLPPEVRTAVILRFEQWMAAYRLRASDAAATAWDGLDSYDEAASSDFQQTVGPLLDAAKGATVALAAAFYSTLLGSSAPAVDPNDVNIEARLGDPMLATWHAFGEGRPFAEAVAAGRSMAEAMAGDFLQSVGRQTGDHVAQQSGKQISRWERIPDAGACEWCQTVADQLYHSADTADFGHDRCACSVVPADESVDQAPVAVSDTTSRGEGRRALGIASHHPR